MSESKKKKWKKINKSVKERPKVQEYKNWEELPPIPISLPIDGSSGTTGDWRTFRPVIDKEKCNQCYFCWMYCPEAVIDIDDEEYPVIDLVYCKGCMICVQECPKKAIEQIREKKEEGD